MLELQWNALRPGDRVAVHDDRDHSSSLSDGVVVLVETTRNGNGVTVRTTGTATRQRELLRPVRLAVHLTPLDPDESCWRCETASPRDDVTPRRRARLHRRGQTVG